MQTDQGKDPLEEGVHSNDCTKNTIALSHLITMCEEALPTRTNTPLQLTTMSPSVGLSF